MPDRVTKPLLKLRGAERSGWDEALAFVVEALKPMPTMTSAR